MSFSGITFRVTHLGPNGEVLGTDPPRDLPVVQRSEPIVTWKQAKLVRSGCEVELRPLNAGMLHVFPSPVRPDAQAVCNNARPHRAPAVDCTCGFYAYDKRPPSDPALVVLEVELSGTVIEHETGYRAQYQRVLGCYLPSRCRAGLLCDQPPAAVRFKEDGKAGEAVCVRHSPGRDEAVTLARLSNALGIECRWDDRGADR